MKYRLIFILCDFVLFYLLVSSSYRITTASFISYFAAIVFSFCIKDLRKISSVSSKSQSFQNYTHYVFIQMISAILKSALVSFFILQIHLPLVVGSGLATISIMLLSRNVLFRYADFHSENRRINLLLDNINLYIVASVLIRLLYLPTVQLSQQEAYYWNYAQRLSYGYLDHPPIVAWFIALGTYIFGNIEVGVRVFTILAWGLTSRMLYLFSRNLFDEKIAKLTLCLFATLPLYFGMGFLTTPDPFLLLAWTGMLYYLEKAIFSFQRERKSWILVGVFLGFGLMSKYSIGLLGVASLVFIIVDKKARRSFLSPWPYLSVVVALFIFSPVIIWNANHEWASFAFQTTRRLQEVPRFSLMKQFSYMILQLTPIGFVSVIVALFKFPQKNRKLLFLACMSLVPLSVFIFFSLKHDVKMSWSAPPWLALFPLIAWSIVNLGSMKMKRVHQYVWYFSTTTVLLILGVGLNYLSLGLPGFEYRKDSPKFISYKEMGISVEKLEDDLEKSEGKEPLIVCMDSYSSASLVSFYRNYHTPYERHENTDFTTSQNFFGLNGLMFDYWLTEPIRYNGTIIVISIVSNRLEVGYLNKISEKQYQYSDIKEVELHKGKLRAGRYFYRIGRLVN